MSEVRIPVSQILSKFAAVSSPVNVNYYRARAGVLSQYRVTWRGIVLICGMTIRCWHIIIQFHSAPIQHNLHPPLYIAINCRQSHITKYTMYEQLLKIWQCNFNLYTNTILYNIKHIISCYLRHRFHLCHHSTINAKRSGVRYVFTDD